MNRFASHFPDDFEDRLDQMTDHADRKERPRTARDKEAVPTCGAEGPLMTPEDRCLCPKCTEDEEAEG